MLYIDLSISLSWTDIAIFIRSHDTGRNYGSILTIFCMELELGENGNHIERILGRVLSSLEGLSKSLLQIIDLSTYVYFPKTFNL